MAARCDSIGIDLEDSAKKRLVEQLVGRTLPEGARVEVVVLEGEVPSEARREGFAEMKRISQEVGEHMRRQGVTDDEFGVAIDEAVDQVRR